MDKLILVKPSKEYSNQILSYRKEFLDNGESIHGTSNLIQFEKVDEWLAWLKQNENEKTCAAGWVPDTLFMCIRENDNRLVGMIDIRHMLNDYLKSFGGHIGFSIRKSERRKGYAKEQLRMALLECKKLNLNQVLITCDKNNTASRKVIISMKGVFENEVYDKSDNTITQRYWIQTESN